MKIYDHVLAVIICVLAPVLALASRRVSTDDLILTSDEKIRLYHSNGLLLVVLALIATTVWRLPGRPLQGLGIEMATPHPYLAILILIIFLFYAADIFIQYGTQKKRLQTIERRSKSLSFIP
ncbi:MAG: hypothetical protein M3R25_13750, partial [Bacteroidota bacterium]|nr:hypothetical protein [Bacteroidota bacterium]